MNFVETFGFFYVMNTCISQSIVEFGYKFFHLERQYLFLLARSDTIITPGSGIWTFEEKKNLSAVFFFFNK